MAIRILIGGKYADSQETLTKNLRYGIVWSRNLDKNAFIENKGCFSQGFPVEKKTLLTAVFISVLLFSVLAGTRFVNRVTANPYLYGGHTQPPEGAEPPTISISSPANNTVLASNNTYLSFNVTMSESTFIFRYIWFEVDWQEGNTSVYIGDLSTPDFIYNQSWITEFSYNKTLTGIPDGSHRITIFASAKGNYFEENTGYSFNINGSSSVYFSIGESFPNTLALAASGASAAFVGLGLLVYFKKRKH